MPEIDNSGTLSIREALKLFALKEEVVGISAAVAAMAVQLERLVPKEVHELHWRNEEARSDRLEDDIKDMNLKLDVIQADKLPKWFLPVAAIIAPSIMATIFLFVSHYWK